MSVWEVESKSEGREPRYVVVVKKSEDENVEEHVKSKYNESGDFADFDVFAKGLKLVATIPPYLAMNLRGVYFSKKDFKDLLTKMKEQAENEASDMSKLISKLGF